MFYLFLSTIWFLKLITTNESSTSLSKTISLESNAINLTPGVNSSNKLKVNNSPFSSIIEAYMVSLPSITPTSL